MSVRIVCSECEQEVRCTCECCDIDRVELDPERLHRACGRDLLALFSEYGISDMRHVLLFAEAIDARTNKAYSLGLKDGSAHA